MEGIYRFKQTAPEIQELLDKVPENAAGIEEDRVAIKENREAIARLSEDVDALKVNEIRVTYWELMSKLQSAKLVSGKVYRITDYETVLSSYITTAQSAGHVFDVLVTAVAENALSEDARAIHHDGDTYFGGSQLKSWVLKYSLFNDTTSFGWADEINGKGVIYFMRDEFGNECGYDFKNIQFKRWSVTDNMEGRNIIGYMGVLDNLAEGLTIPDEDDWRWAYTFDSNGVDASLKVVGSSVALDNIINATEDARGKKALADNVFYGVAKRNKLGYNCGNNTFLNATDNTLGSRCGANAIMSMLRNTIGLFFFGNSVETLQGDTINNSVSSNVWKTVAETNIGAFVSNNAWEDVRNSTIGNSIDYTLMEGTLRFVQILDGVMGESGSPITIPFDSDAGTDVQCAGMMGGAVKVWKPAEIDTTPTSGSDNPVSSGGVYTALSGKADSSDLASKEDKVDIVSASGATLTAEVGKYYTLSSVGTLAITLPTIASGTTKVQTVTFYIAAGSSPAVTWTSTHTIIFADGFQIEANGLYEISAAWNGIGWIIGMLKLVAPNS